jgi:hypothetical protein
VLETPQAAIPYYLLCGLAMAPLFRQAERVTVYDDEPALPAHVPEYV